MADTLRRAQKAPAAGTWATLIQANAPTVISTIRACNRGATKDVIDVRIVYAGEAEADKQYVCDSLPLPLGWPYSATEGWTLVADDLIMVRSRNGTTAFNVSGVEKN